MTGPHRLPASAPARFGAAIDRSEPVGFRFGSRVLSGLYGDTLTSALLASGVTSWASSPKLRRPRGPMSTGLEIQTPLILEVEGLGVAVSGGEVAIREGMAARAAPLGLDGLLARLPQAIQADAALPASRRLLERIGRVLPLPSPRLPARVPLPAARREACDVLVIGAGVAGLAASEAALAAGLDVRVVDAARSPGGLADLSDGTVDGAPAAGWAARKAGALADRRALLLRATAISIDPEGAVTLIERPERHGPPALVVVSASAIVVATGHRERPLVFSGNDRPGVSLSVATRALLRRHAVAPGERVFVATLGDDGYRTALDLKEAGVEVPMVFDAREDPQGPAVDMAKAAGVPVSLATLVAGVAFDETARKLVGVRTVNRYGEGSAAGARDFAGDALVVSGGFAPRDELLAGYDVSGESGLFSALDGPDLAGAVRSGWAAGVAAARRLGADVPAAGPTADATVDDPDGPQSSYLDRLREGQDAASSFVDLGADVTVADIIAAIAAGVTGGELLARRLGLGLGADGGRLSADLPSLVYAALGGGSQTRAPVAGRPTLGLIAARAGLLGR